jgi:hypothetical protein
VLTVASLLVAVATAQAETIDDLLDLLKAKGAITQAEYDMLNARQRAEAKKTEQKLLDAEAKAQQAKDKLREIKTTTGQLEMRTPGASPTLRGSRTHQHRRRTPREPTTAQIPAHSPNG